MNSEKLGLIIKNQRKSLGLTQTEVALSCGVGIRFISDLENGKPSCAMRDIGTFKNGRIEIPIEKKEDMADADRTLMLLELKDKDNLALRSKGTRKQYWIVLSLFCNTSTTLADNYARVTE